MTTLFAAVDTLPKEAVGVIEEAGHTPNGYFLGNLTKYLLRQANITTETLEPLHTQLTDLFNNTTDLQRTLKRAKAAGTDFDD